MQVSYTTPSSIPRLSEGNRQTIIEIFSVLKTFTGKSFRNLKIESIDPKHQTAKKLLTLLFVHYKITPYLLCYYFNASTEEVDAIWRSARKDPFIRKELELARAIIGAASIANLSPQQGLVNFKANYKQWLGDYLTEQQMKDVLAYVGGTLTGLESVHIHDSLASIRGLQLVSRDVKARKMIMHYMSMCGLCSYIGNIEYQAKRAGYTLYV